jgi:hypothetical protein
MRAFHTLCMPAKIIQVSAHDCSLFWDQLTPAADAISDASRTHVENFIWYNSFCWDLHSLRSYPSGPVTYNAGCVGSVDLRRFLFIGVTSLHTPAINVIAFV